MFVIVKHKDALADPAKKPATSPLFESPDQNRYFFDLDPAQAEALRLARAIPGYQYDVFELVLKGTAQTPAAVWSAATPSTGGN